MSHLSKNYQVLLVSFFQGKKINESYLKPFQDLGIEVHIIKLNPLKAGIKAIFGLFQNIPLEISYYNDNFFQSKVNELISKNNFKLSFAFFMRTAKYLESKELQKILIAEDCRTLYQHRSYLESKGAIQKIVRYIEWKLLSKYEFKQFDKFNRVTFVSNQDINYSKNQNSFPNYFLLSNGTDTNKFNSGNNLSNRQDIVFVGKLDIWANILMIRKISENILPLILKELPNVKFNIVGANAGTYIKSLVSQNIILHENVKDVVPYLQSARVFLHPHSGGSGIQNKIIEALSCGCPVVTTITGNQGINAIDNQSILIANDEKNMAELVIKILKNDQLLSHLSQNGREHILNNLSWEHIYKQLDDLVNEQIL